MAGSHFGDTMNELDSKSYLNSLEFVHKLNTILRELFEQYVGKNRNRQKERKKGRKLLDAVDYVNSHGGGENFQYLFASLEDLVNEKLSEWIKDENNCHGIELNAIEAVLSKWKPDLANLLSEKRI